MDRWDDPKPSKAKNTAHQKQQYNVERHRSPEQETRKIRTIVKMD